MKNRKYPYIGIFIPNHNSDGLSVVFFTSESIGYCMYDTLSNRTDTIITDWIEPMFSKIRLEDFGRI